MFFRSLLASALATVALAQESSRVLYFTRVPNPVTAGQPQALIYSTNDTTSPVTITLRKGLSTNLQTIETLTSSATGGQYVWTPSNTLENDSDYALQIEQGSQLNYYGPFTLQGSSEEESSSSASGSATSSASRTSITSAATYPAGNATRTAAGTGSLGTGTSIPRNTTMSSQTLSNTATSSRTPTPSSTTEGGDLQATSTPSGVASSLMAGGSAMALVLGAVGAIVLG